MGGMARGDALFTTGSGKLTEKRILCQSLAGTGEDPGNREVLLLTSGKSGSRQIDSTSMGFRDHFFSHLTLDA